MAAVQQEAERLTAARLQQQQQQAPSRFNPVPARPAGVADQQVTSPTAGIQVTSVPGQPVRIRGPAVPVMRPSGTPQHSTPADLRKYGRPQGEPNLSELRQHSVIDNFLNR